MYDVFYTEKFSEPGLHRKGCKLDTFRVFAHRCTTGKHTSEKPQTTFTPARKNTHLTPATRISTLPVTREACSRCRQGFFCADHGTLFISWLLLIHRQHSENSKVEYCV